MVHRRSAAVDPCQQRGAHLGHQRPVVRDRELKASVHVGRRVVPEVAADQRRGIVRRDDHDWTASPIKACRGVGGPSSSAMSSFTTSGLTNDMAATPSG